MIKVILSTLISVFLLVCAVTIFYWRDSKFDPSSQDLLIFFGLIPLGISLVLLTPYFLVKAYKYRQAQKLEAEQQALEQQNRPAAPEKVKALEHVKLNVFSASLQSSFGQNQEVFTQIAEMSGANLDPSLVSAYGLPILSFRIDDLEDEADSDQDSDEMGSNDLNPLQRRMTKFIQRELENNTESLANIAEHLKQSAMFYDSKLAYEYRMHPAWINPNIDVHEEDEVKVTPVEVYRLNRVNVHIVLADTLLHTWDESQSETVIGQYLDDLGIIAQQINIEYQYWGAGNEYHEWINLIKNIQNQPHEVSLMLVQDSEIDQVVYDDRACIVRNTWNFARFYHHESCGQCTPCREGTGWLEKVLWRIENGQGRDEDIDLLWSIQSKIEGNTICPLGDAASWPVAAAIPGCVPQAWHGHDDAARLPPGPVGHTRQSAAAG